MIQDPSSPERNTAHSTQLPKLLVSPTQEILQTAYHQLWLVPMCACPHNVVQNMFYNTRALVVT